MSPVAEDKDVLRAQFERFAAGFASGDAAFLRPLRTAAIARFAERGFPTTKDEDWKYTSVAEVARTPFARPARFAVSRAELTAAGLLPTGGVEIVFVNGRLAPELTARKRGLGFEVTSLAEALAADPARIEAHLAQVVPYQKSAFAALSTAFIEDGAVVEITGAVAEPIHLVFYSRPDGEPSVSYPRVLVLARRASQATLVESYLGSGRSLTSAVTEIVLEAGALFSHVKLQQEATTAFHVGAIGASQGRDSRFVSHHVALGAALARTDIETRFDGPGGACEMNGLFLTNGAQHTDTHTRIDHAQPHCSSRELYKGVLDGKSRGVFHGRIVVRKDAQKTDAHQANKNLLLSKDALVQSIPQLEILADDVKCKHGSTTGQLDEVALFYLRSRGIGEAEARGLLTYAFASELVERIPIPVLRAALEAELGARLQAEPHR